jgi:hypothetical protein
MRTCDHCGQPASQYDENGAICEVCFHKSATEFFDQFRIPRWVLVLRLLGWLAGAAFALYLLIGFIKFCWTHA